MKEHEDNRLSRRQFDPFGEGQPVSVQIFNDTDTPEFVHWHGQFIPSEVDGAGEELSPSNGRCLG